MFVAGENVGLAEWIIDDTCLVLFLVGLLYLGGIEQGQVNRAKGQGLKSRGASLEGCMKDLELDGRQIGLAEVKVTSGIRSGCAWTFPCLLPPDSYDSKGQKCNDGHVCVQKGIGGYECRDGMGGMDESPADADTAVEVMKIQGEILNKIWSESNSTCTTCTFSNIEVLIGVLSNAGQKTG